MTRTEAEIHIRAAFEKAQRQLVDAKAAGVDQQSECWMGMVRLFQRERKVLAIWLRRRATEARA